MHILSHVNSRWAEALLPLSPLQQAQLVWEDLQWGNGAQELFPGREGVLLSASPAVMTSCPRPARLTYRLEILQRRGPETMHYWVWCSMTKRSGHLTALPHGSMRCSHHWWIPTMWSLRRIDLKPARTQFVFCAQCLKVPSYTFTFHHGFWSSLALFKIKNGAVGGAATDPGGVLVPFVMSQQHGSEDCMVKYPPWQKK